MAGEVLYVKTLDNIGEVNLLPQGMKKVKWLVITF
jgi:hypothetical protein